MTWKIEFEEIAAKEFKKLPIATRKEIYKYFKRILKLSNPKEMAKPLRHDKAGLYRYRIGKYRVICNFEENKLVIIVLRVGKRDKIYK